eukprot:1127166-Pyramimonas_sp.AAC.1
MPRGVLKDMVVVVLSVTKDQQRHQPVVAAAVFGVVLLAAPCVHGGVHQPGHVHGHQHADYKPPHLRKHRSRL